MNCLALRLFTCALLLLLAACRQKSGPEDVRLGRDMCDLCRMTISEGAFAAELRAGDAHELFRFDDLGCALRFGLRRGLLDLPSTDAYVADVERTDGAPHWLDARRAFYELGHRTPMDFGYGAHAEQKPGTLTFTQVLERLMEREQQRKAVSHKEAGK